MRPPGRGGEVLGVSVLRLHTINSALVGGAAPRAKHPNASTPMAAAVFPPHLTIQYDQTSPKLSQLHHEGYC